ncbi:MAG: polyprenyl synthetase family protein [Actinobacteria bacterium]|nr:polyprenyl synthetase family protein [Actinomycetota bacterium]
MTAAPRGQLIPPPPAHVARAIDVRPVLVDVERRLREHVATSARFVEEAARYLMEAGGKRFRPMLVALCSHLGDPWLEDGEVYDPRIAEAGVVVELVHLATLYHDDVIDEAPARRGTRSANVRWDNTVAVLTGDYLFARASELSADLGVEVTQIMARTIATLCEGQISEVQGSRGALPPDVPPLDPTLDHYLDVVSKKTASLIATSCRLGTLLSGCDTPQVEAATAYGWSLGMAFQLSDDILDVASGAEQSGKTPGTDLREGVRTLPVLYALEDEPDGELAALLDTDVLTDEAVTRALGLLRSSAALARAHDLAAAYAAAAKDVLVSFPPSAATTALAQLADFTVVRTG